MRLVCYGDSITHGVGANRASAPYICRLCKKLDAEIVSQANSGYIYDAETLCNIGPVDAVIAAYGTNDRCRKTAEQFRADTEAFYRRLAEVYPGTRVYAVTPPWTVGEDEEAGTFHGKIIGTVCKAWPNITVVDGHRMIPHNPEYFADGVHPNDAGYRYYAENLYRTIKNTADYNNIQ